MIRGRLTNIEGGDGSGEENQPRMVTFKPNDAAERQVPFKDVRRIYLGNFPVQTEGTTSLSSRGRPPGSVNVPANARWVATNITVGRNDRVAFSATGQVQLSPDAEDKASPAGSLRGTRATAAAPAPTLLAGALIGRIGTGAPFAIGDQTQPLSMPAAGPLFLAVNDDQVDDNRAFSPSPCA